MTLLKDLVWHSALRGRGAGEVEIGSGDSSFTHLVEDGDTGALAADRSLYVGDGQYYAGFDPSGDEWINGAAGAGIHLVLDPEASPRLEILTSGVVQWNDEDGIPVVGQGRAPDGPQLVWQKPDGTGPAAWLDLADPQGGSFYVYSELGEAGFNGTGGFASILDPVHESEAFVSKVEGDVDFGFSLLHDGTNFRMYFGPGDELGKDTIIGRSAVGVFAIGRDILPTALELWEQADVAAPLTNSLRLYGKDVGGKTALMCRFPTGAPQQIAIEL